MGLKILDLDRINKLSSISRADVFVKFVYEGICYCVVIEDTGTPEIVDLNKLEQTIEGGHFKEECGNCVKVKVLHHSGGVFKSLYGLATFRRVRVIGAITQ